MYGQQFLYSTLQLVQHIIPFNRVSIKETTNESSVGLPVQVEINPANRQPYLKFCTNYFVKALNISYT